MHTKPGPIDPEQLRGRRVTVMGLGSFGGGSAVVRFLCRYGAAVRVSEQKSHQELSQTISELDELSGIDWRTGGHEWSHFEDADLVVVNPAVRPDHPLLIRLVRDQRPLTTEMNLFWQLNPGKVIAVTGSNGKSTTTALIHTLLEADGKRAWLGGNIGRSLLPMVDRIQPDDWVVLELSSFQLERLSWLCARPDIAVVTNFSANHLDWHGSLEAYATAKQAILRWQLEEDRAVLNGNDSTVTHWPGRARRLLFLAAGSTPNGFRVTAEGIPAADVSDGDSVWLEGDSIRGCVDGDPFRVSLASWRLRGQHNRDNALAAVAAARLAGADEQAIEQGLSGFVPLPHRLQPVGEVQRRQFVNDSIATTPEAAIAALQAFDEPVVLLAGGYDKQVDLEPLVHTIGRRVRAVAFLGSTGPDMARQLSRQPASPPHCVASSLPDAVRWAMDHSRPGDVVLLSPGCASYDWFQSFEDRGRQFAALASQLATGASDPNDRPE